jgi:hypothetical protein
MLGGGCAPHMCYTGLRSLWLVTSSSQLLQQQQHNFTSGKNKAASTGMTGMSIISSWQSSPMQHRAHQGALCTVVAEDADAHVPVLRWHGRGGYLHTAQAVVSPDYRGRSGERRTWGAARQLWGFSTSRCPIELKLQAWSSCAHVKRREQATGHAPVSSAEATHGAPGGGQVLCDPGEAGRRCHTTQVRGCWPLGGMEAPGMCCCGELGGRT